MITMLEWDWEPNWQLLSPNVLAGVSNSVEPDLAQTNLARGKNGEPGSPG